MSKRTLRSVGDNQAYSRKKLLRDTRTLPERIKDGLSDSSLHVFLIFANIPIIFIFPAFSVFGLSIGILIFLLRMITEKYERLPFRMPLGTPGVDRSDPKPGRRGYAKPNGSFFVGNSLTKEELWLKKEDILTHAMIFGTTGSGKTETLVSMSFNPLASGSGLFYIDPKASPKLGVQIWQMARFMGRDDDFRVINYGTSGKAKGKTPSRISNTTNPFTVGSAEALTQLLVSLMPASEGGNSVFSDKAQALLAGIMYAIVDLRDKGLMKISTAKIREMLQAQNCVKLATNENLSESAKLSLEAGLSGSNWTKGKAISEQPDAFFEQFGYAQSYFTKALSSLTDTYSHIYGADDGEVDFSDVIMQQRILVVLLPALEKSPQELSSLGKISLSSIKTACAVGLGSIIEGDAKDVLESLPTQSIGIGSFLTIVDEYAAIVTPGFEIVLTQGRGLGISAIVASQDYAGILEADKKGAQQMVANTTIKIFMKLQDADSTFKLAKELAGQSTVVRTSGFSIEKQEELASYRDSLQTTIDKEDRIDLRDLQEQIQGEAHFIFNGDVVAGETFFANPNLKGAQLRVPQLIQCKGV